MKKSILTFLVIINLAACKKEYTCECVSVDVSGKQSSLSKEVYKTKKRSEANNKCNGGDTKVGGGRIECELLDEQGNSTIPNQEPSNPPSASCTPVSGFTEFNWEERDTPTQSQAAYMTFKSNGDYFISGTKNNTWGIKGCDTIYVGSGPNSFSAMYYIVLQKSDTMMKVKKTWKMDTTSYIKYLKKR